MNMLTERQATEGKVVREFCPDHDPTALWDQHTACEFVTRDVAATMTTMVSGAAQAHKLLDEALPSNASRPGAGETTA